ncbi:hypothetical protein FOXB_02720 [Fusarium oxysporum f. sp. conglutinans Fo5176]|uniref:DDE-1 domain-containing protein n=1 Tax=Fusarium oxysporum (strain Fo5176) TaxID=660025 RepID=F9F8J5_FUSOF|nr:hypothetical protein FOXB_02720 [Fusarium oxysporum f. sp. conglutinans Fo5176]
MSQSNKEARITLALQAYQADPKLSLRRAAFIFARKYDYRRAKCEDPTIIRNWFKLVENTIAKYGIRSDDIWNFDETGFMMGMIEPGIVVTSSERRGKPKSVQPGNREWATVIQAINAEGQAIDPFIVVAGQYHLANWYQESNLPGTWAIATTENGWTDNETGLEWLKHFNRATTNQSTGPYRLLILDGHESHQSADFQIYCEENNIITLYRLIKRSITHISKPDFFLAFYAAFQATITEKNIKGGFKGAGLAPLDPEYVISKLDVQLRTPTPPQEVTEPMTPWAARTPKTILKTQSHSKYLQGRIRNHKSSSPESIIEAINPATVPAKPVPYYAPVVTAEGPVLAKGMVPTPWSIPFHRSRLELGMADSVNSAENVPGR